MDPLTSSRGCEGEARAEVVGSAELTGYFASPSGRTGVVGEAIHKNRARRWVKRAFTSRAGGRRRRDAIQGTHSGRGARISAFAHEAAFRPVYEFTDDS